MKTVYLHIGHFKTGTSAIQKYLSDNRPLFLEYGYNYLAAARATTNPTTHSQLALSLYGELGGKTPEWYDDRQTYQELAKQVREEIDTSPLDKHVISSEEYYRYGSLKPEASEQAARKLGELLQGYHVVPIMYVREPFGFIKSWYNQVNKGPSPFRRFADFFLNVDIAMLIPQPNAEFWRGIFGHESLVVVPYLGDQERHLESFFDAIGLSLPSSVPPTSALVNVRREERDLEVDRLMRIAALDNPAAWEGFLRSAIFRDRRTFNRMQRKIRTVNREFKAFCRDENLDIPFAGVDLGDILIHEERVNPKSASLEMLLSEISGNRGLKRRATRLLPKRVQTWLKNTMKP